jgi:hypothetical protein
MGSSVARRWSGWVAGGLTLGLACLLAGCSGEFGTNNGDDGGNAGDADGGTGGGGGGDMAQGGGDPEGNALLNGITAAHNAARAAVMPMPTTPMPALTWSSTVAATAQAWANNCQWMHSTSSYGENIFADTGQSNAQAVVADWVSEKQFYTYSTNTCQAGKSCGHYTQVVWAKSLRLGCAVKQCTTGSPFGAFNGGRWTFWVCNYDPPGNFTGQKPY